MTREEQAFLERLHNPEASEQESRQSDRERRQLFRRNVLNGTFILLACIAMGLIAYSWFSHAAQARLWGIGVGLVAVMLKMAEATMRIPTMLKKPEYEKRRYHQA